MQRQKFRREPIQVAAPKHVYRYKDKYGVPR